MKIFKNRIKLQKEILKYKNLSFVPTMGALHKGHVSLIKKSKKYKGKTVVSIFVNPKQFDRKNDFLNYPIKLKKDLKILRRLKVDFLYLPNEKDIFSFKTSKSIYLHKFAKKLCGVFRKTHFSGVLNVINRFLEIIKPKYLFLGNKDFQQLYLIKKHIKFRKIKTKVISCKTIREKNGLPSSSRNNNLTTYEIKVASKVSRFLKKIKKEKNYYSFSKIKNKINSFGIKKVEYLKFLNAKNLKEQKKLKKNTIIFIAFYVKKVRLIDNI